MCAQTSNDCKGLTYVSNDSGKVLFQRPTLAASGVIMATAVTTTPNWTQYAGNSLDLYATIATGTGAVTLPTSSTATTGPVG